jgi:hypothetical protein
VSARSSNINGFEFLKIIRGRRIDSGEKRVMGEIKIAFIEGTRDPGPPMSLGMADTRIKA